MSEADHRIANNLAVIAGLVQLYIRNLPADEETMPVGQVRMLLEEIRGRIDTVGRLHRLLVVAGDGSPVDIGRYVCEIAESMVSSLSLKGNVQVQHRIDPDCRLPPEQALYVGLIAGEVVTNSLKYAHPTGAHGEIAISCQPGPHDTVVIEISDDGIGLPQDFDAAGDGGTGLHLVRTLAEQVGATCKFQTDGLGLRFVLEVAVKR